MKKKAPLRIIGEGKFCIEKKSESCGVVIFGATGDLAKRKLIPALFSLHKDKLLPKDFFILGCARSDWTKESFRKKIDSDLGDAKEKKDKSLRKQFLDKIYYERGDFSKPEAFFKMSETLKTLHRKYETKENAFFYLAVRPEIYSDIIKALKDTKNICPSSCRDGWTRVIIEKPFGSDLKSSENLSKEISSALDENQIYRMDHYLGKETVQNIFMFRFANTIFEPVWNSHYIDNVQITVAEDLGVEGRADYYEKAGALRDIFQNHMFQLLAMVAMEPPIQFNDKCYRDEKVKLVKAVRPIPEKKLNEFIIRGQYTKETRGKKKIKGYKEEAGVSPDSETETFVAMKLFIDNLRWAGVPFYLRTGKRMAKKTTTIAIQFKKITHSMFPGISPDMFSENVLIFRIQPDEGISLHFEAKHPGPKMCMATLGLEVNYKDVFGKDPTDAYERLLIDCMQGDQTLFVRKDMVDLSWEFITPILEEWKNETKPLSSYRAGSWGPKEADRLIQKDGRKWIAE